MCVYCREDAACEHERDSCAASGGDTCAACGHTSAAVGAERPPYRTTPLRARLIQCRSRSWSVQPWPRRWVIQALTVAAETSRSVGSTSMGEAHRAGLLGGSGFVGVAASMWGSVTL